MTVCVAIQVNDCLVFAADSASSMIGIDPAGNQVVSNVYNHGRKVFSLYKGLPIVAMTCGMGNIQGSSIDVLAKDLRLLFATPGGAEAIDPSSFTVEEFCQKARTYFESQYLSDLNRPQGPHSFELYVGGISSGERLGEVWKFSIINGTVSPAASVFPKGESGVIWAGQPEALNRLLVGFSSRLEGVLVGAGVQQPQLGQLLTAISNETRVAITHPAMPVQDAIDLAMFLVSVTIGFTKFQPGANTVGGDIDVATVTRHEGFKWIKRKHYYSGALNPLETDHVGSR